MTKISKTVGISVLFLFPLSASALVKSECRSSGNGNIVFQTISSDPTDSTLAFDAKLFLGSSEVQPAMDSACRIIPNSPAGTFGCSYQGYPAKYFVDVELGTDNIANTAFFSVWDGDNMTEHAQLTCHRL